MDGKPARNLTSSAGAAVEDHTIPRKNAVLPVGLARRQKSGIMPG